MRVSKRSLKDKIHEFLRIFCHKYCTRNHRNYSHLLYLYVSAHRSGPTPSVAHKTLPFYIKPWPFPPTLAFTQMRFPTLSSTYSSDPSLEYQRSALSTPTYSSFPVHYSVPATPSPLLLNPSFPYPRPAFSIFTS